MAFYLRDIAGTIAELASLAVGVSLRKPSSAYVTQVTVGTAAAALAAAPATLGATPILKAHPANLGIIYIGTSNAVTAANGFPLAAGDPLPATIDDLSKLWAIASVADQKLGVFAGTG